MQKSIASILCVLSFVAFAAPTVSYQTATNIAKKVIDQTLGDALDDKRDKDDLAVYSVTRTENTDWTWTSENKELEEVLNDSGVKPIWYETGSGWSEVDPLPDGWGLVQGSTGSPHDAVNLICWFCKLSGDYVEYIATATRPRYMDETLGPAKQNQQLAAVATDDAAKPADGSLMKYDAANDRFVKAVEGTDYLKTHQDISGKLDKSGGQMTGTLSGGDGFGWIMNRQGESLHDVLGTFPTYLDLDTKADRATTLAGYGITDGATKTELAGKRDHGDFAVASGEKTVKFGEWNVTGSDVQPGAVYSLRLTESELTDQWDLLEDGNLIDSAVYDKSVAKSVTEISPADWFNHSQITATRTSLVYVDGPDTFVGAKYVDGKRDLTDNVCRKTEFTEWICNPPRTEFGGVYSVRYDSPVKVYSLFDNDEVVEEIYSPTDDKLNLEFVGYCTATRSAVCTDGKKFVTSDVVDGKVSSAVSTNNPAFVSAVRNTPAPEPGQGEDPPWGTWGTVGAAIAGLVAGLKWLKDKVFDSAGNIQDQFATDLLGKQVAKEAIIYKANTATGLKDRAFNALSLDGTEYNLSTALAAVTPTVENQPRDLLIVATATASTTISFTAGTIKGDKPTIDGAGTWLITLTEYAANTWYCRQIKMEDAA